jgi:hypothetical protein
MRDTDQTMNICAKIIPFVVFCLLKAANVHAADLQAQTIAAWDHYVAMVQARAEIRLHSQGQFLWLDEDLKRAQRIRNGEIEVVPLAGNGFARVPDGLIHDWMGAVFIPNKSVEQVLELLTDYDKYTTIYGPEVADAKRLAHGADHDEFSMKIINKVMFVTAGVNMSCISRSVQLDERRAYSTSQTVNVREIRDYGEPGERELAPDTGDGFIWRLFSLARLEERDGGVYVETERLALTRDMPGSLAFVVAPVIKRLSRNSMTISLQKTREAARSVDYLAKQTQPMNSVNPMPPKSFAAR